MRPPLFLFTGILMLAAAPAGAQEANPSATTTPEGIAARTMKAMEALGASAAESMKPVEGKAPDSKDRKEKGTKFSKTNASSKNDSEEEDSPTPALLPAAAAQEARGVDPMSRARMDLMIPAGRSHKGVHYPMYGPVETDRAGVDLLSGGMPGVVAPLASLFESEVVTRLDDDHVQFDRAKWVQFAAPSATGGEGKPTMTLEIERGVYDLKNEILMTNQPVKIENQQFLITGDTMLHDRASGLTRLTGRVKMTFYNEESDVAPATPGPAASPSPSTSEAPRQP